MNNAITLRPMTPADLAFADAVRGHAGWNQLPADWRRLLEYEPGGCFVAEWEGTPAGTATTSRYGTVLAWIGMVLVHPDYRRRGLGQALLHQCLEYLREVPCVKLDATPLGKGLYEQLGFQGEAGLQRWQGTGPGHRAVINPALRSWDDALLDALSALDQPAFGAPRPAMLKALANGSAHALIHREHGEVKGYGLLRPGTRAHYIGPVVAATAQIGCQLVSELAAQAPPGQPIYWDIFDDNTEAVELAKVLGFTPQRPFLRMFRGHNTCPGDPRRQFAIGDPATG